MLVKMFKEKMKKKCRQYLFITPTAFNTIFQNIFSMCSRFAFSSCKSSFLYRFKKVAFREQSIQFREPMSDIYVTKKVVKKTESKKKEVQENWN